MWSANGDATFEAWLWINDFNQDRTIMHTADAASGNSSSDISIQSDRQIRVHPLSSNAMDTASVLQAQQWFHLALVQSSTTRKVYINGNEQAMTTVAGNANTAAWDEPAETMYIGEQNDRYFFSGHMQDIRVYDKQKYTANFQPPTRNEFTVHNLAGGPKNYTRFWTGTGPIAGNNGGCFAYNSTTSSGDHGSGGTGTYIVWTPSPAITINSSARLYMTQGSASQCTINGTSFTTTNNAWNDITSHCSGTLSTLRLDAGAGSAWAKVWQVEIDGEILKCFSKLNDVEIGNGNCYKNCANCISINNVRSGVRLNNSGFYKSSKTAQRFFSRINLSVNFTSYYSFWAYQNIEYTYRVGCTILPMNFNKQLICLRLIYNFI